MKLQALRIENHSRLEDMSIEVRDHLVLVGPNDSGKSSILRCLDFLLGASTGALYARLGAADLRDVNQPLVVEAVLVDFSDEAKALFPDEIVVATTANTSSLTIRLTVMVDDNESLDVSRTAPGGGTGRQVSRDQLSGIGWKMISAIAGARDVRDERNRSLDDILHAIDLGAERQAFDLLAQQLKDRLDGSAVLDGLRDQLAGHLSKALPEGIDKADLSFVPGASADGDVLSDVRLQIRRSGSLRNLADQSDGTRALFAIALYDLVSASAHVVAIDEPEIHLHPTSQRSLARLLQTGGNQKIIATHSTDVVGAFSSECIVSVKPGGKVVQPLAGFLSSDQRMSIRWWVRDKLEPLTAARVVAVEGVSDRIVVERVADVTGRDLDRLGVSVIETEGAGNMGAVIKLFGSTGFQVDMSLLIDQDAALYTAAKLGVPEADLEQHSVWTSMPDLEGEYVAALGASSVWAAINASGLFSSNELGSCASTGAGGTRTDSDVASFCRSSSKHKVRSALAIAPMLSDSTARAVTSVEKLLSEFAGV